MVSGRLAVVALASCAAMRAAVAPDDLPRMSICLNGEWEVALNAPGDRIPESGFAPRRVPAAPIATNPPTVSAWYRLKFAIPRAWSRRDRAFLLRIGKAGHYAAIYWNGKMAGEHYGQFTGFEADVTSAMRPGEVNEIAVFVHNASGRYARPGAEISDPMEGNAYRGATEQPVLRNWIGIVGDVDLTWRPAAAYIEDVRVTTSVQRHRIRADVTASGGLALATAVLDGDRVVLRLPANRDAEWADPVLWGPEPYGKPKLYVLRTELRNGNRVVDRTFTRFGFREVWIEGKDVLLNGKKLWMAGTYFSKLAPIRYINDRRPQAKVVAEMQASGLNTMHGHWDELGDAWLDRCDEAGIVVPAGFFCDGRPQIQSRADGGWVGWMTATCRDWVRARRHHPSIVMWRPTDVLPANVAGRRPEISAGFAEQVRKEDGTRPLADDSDIFAYAQSPLKNPQPGAGPRQLSAADYDDGSRMAALLARTGKPFLTKEIYTGFTDFDNVGRFFRDFYEKSYTGGATGVIVQHLPIVQGGERVALEWASASGEGNRETNVPEARPEFKPSPYSRLFAELYQQFTGRAPAVASGDPSGEVLVSGLKADEVTFLVPQNPETDDAVATRAAADGTAWSVVSRAGTYRLYYDGGSRVVRVAARAVERVRVR